jgi:hypothetical protein
MMICMYVCIRGIIWEFMNMNEIVKLFECFNMMIIGELHVLFIDYAWFVNTWIATSLIRKMW